MADAAKANGEPEKKGGFKFSITRKATQRKRDIGVEGDGEKDTADEKELIVALQGSDVVAADGSISTKGAPKVIPSQGNTWKPGGKPSGGRQSALDEIIHDVENTDRFEVVADEEKDSGQPYGLSVRGRAAAGTRDQSAQVSLRDLETQKLKEDLGNLPDEVGMDAYASMPIEGFGEALLRGMGWEKGKGIGRNGKGDAEAVEYVPRPNRLGLGATPKQKPEQEKKYIKPGETRNAPKDLVAPEGPDGKRRHVKKISEKLVERDRGEVREGKLVMIVHGRHEGLEGQVRCLLPTKAKDGTQKWTVRLVKSEEDVDVWEDEIQDKKVWHAQKEHEQVKRKALADAERAVAVGDDERRPAKRSRESRSGAGFGDPPGEGDMSMGYDGNKEVRRDSRAVREDKLEAYAVHTQERRSSGAVHTTLKHSRQNLQPGELSKEGRGRSKSNQSDRATASASTATAAKSWLMPHIRVRIITKEKYGGRLYLNKGVIVDVVTPIRCDVLLDGEAGKLVEGISTDDIETALPKRGGRVAVLRGEHRGERGKLLERSSEMEVAVVQLSQTFDIIRLPLDDVAEFVGDEVAYES